LFSGFALVSESKTAAIIRGSRKDQCMLKKIMSGLAFAGILLRVSVVSAETVSQNFVGDPLTNGWSVFGSATLFTWDSTNQNLRVTWDSTQTNSYFYHSLGGAITRNDDFQVEFDLTLSDCISGNEPGKTGPLQIGIGLFNLAAATSTNFGRGVFGSAPNLAEFNYFPYGYYTFGSDIFPSDATTVFDFISSSGFSYAPTFFDPFYEFDWPTNQLVHVAIAYTAQNQTLALTLRTNGTVAYQPPNIVLNNPANSGFGVSDNFNVDTFSVSSYSSYRDDYNSVLAHGTVDNLFVHVPPVQNLTGTFSNSVWQVQFRSRSNWVYTLERTADFSSWTNVSPVISGSATNVYLQDTNPPVGKAFYRVYATQP
jgi:hypothetical protein